MEVGCQGFSQNRLKSSITSCFFHSTWRLHNRETHGRTLQLYHYIVLHLAWHRVAFQCNTVHYIAVRCIPLRCAALHCNYRALRYVALQCVMCVRRLHSLTFHWIALRCNAWQYSVHGLLLICTICMHACLQTYFSTNVEINWKTDKQPASQPGKQIDRHGDRRTCRDRYRDYDAETSHQWKKTDKLEFVW